jgi:hypothetical protein
MDTCIVWTPSEGRQTARHEIPAAPQGREDRPRASGLNVLPCQSPGKALRGTHSAASGACGRWRRRLFAMNHQAYMRCRAGSKRAEDPAKPRHRILRACPSCPRPREWGCQPARRRQKMLLRSAPLLELGVRPFSREFLWRHARLAELELTHATVLQKVLTLPRHDAFVNRPLPLLALQPAAHPLG